ncbi:MAG: DUF3443 family protein [Terriglobales bacterium]
MRTALIRVVSRGLWALAVLPVFGVLAACGGGGSSSSSPPPATGNNVQAIMVNGGPAPGVNYSDAAFTSVTVCVPSSSNCSTVDGILVDTGSVGLRLLASAIPSLTLPELSGSGNTTYYNCVDFVDGTYLWGPVAQADIEMAGEKASAASLQLIENPVGFSVPSACSQGGVNLDTLNALGANGILGVGSYPQDCGQACQSSTSPNVYFTCGPTGPCSSQTITVAQQVINPVIGFSTDNNGVIIEMQTVDGEAATASGSMIFGIGTQSNNALGSATVYTLSDGGFMTTDFNSQTLTESFIDSGSNGYFFPDSSIPQCAENSIAPGFYCPNSTLSLSAQNVTGSGAKNTVTFSVDNAVNDFNDFGSDTAFANLAGPNGSSNCGGGTACGFDWGLPFFFGRNVFVSIAGQSVPSGTPAAPWWAY